MCRNKIQDVPSHIVNIPTVEILDLSFNKIENIDANFGKLKGLKCLILANNNIRKLPPEMKELGGIEEIDISNNFIEIFPNISKWTKLKSFTAKNNRLREIPDGLDHCLDLESLDLTMNYLRKMEKFFVCTKLVNLRLKHNGIEVIPKEIANLVNITDFNMDNNDILEIPDEITSLTKLKTLNLSFNAPNGLKYSSEVKTFLEKNNVILTQEFEYASKVFDGLYISGASAASNKHLLKSLGITHVITVAHDIMPPYPELFSYLVIYVEDIRASTLIPHFDDTNRFIDEARSKGGAALIHCMAGKSRSATITCAYIMYHKRLKVKDAFTILKKARNVVDPNDTFKKELKTYEKFLSFEQDKEVEIREKNPWEMINAPKDSLLHHQWDIDQKKLKFPRKEPVEPTTPIKGSQWESSVESPPPSNGN